MGLKITVSYIIVYFVWGTSMLATRYLVNDSDVIWGFAFRYIGATALLGLATVLYGPFRKQWRPGRQELINASISGVILLVIAILLRAFSLQSISSGELGILSALTPLFIALFAWQMTGCKPKSHHILGGALGISGTVLLSLDRISSVDGSGYATGILFAIAGVLLWAFGTVLQKILAHPESAISRVLIQNSVAAITLTILAAAVSGNPTEMILKWQPETCAAFLHLTVLGSTISTVAYIYLLQNEPLLRVSTTSFVIPVIAVLAGGFAGGEDITPGVLAALGISLLGTVTAMWGPQIQSRLRGQVFAMTPRQ